MKMFALLVFLVGVAMFFGGIWFACYLMTLLPGQYEAACAFTGVVITVLGGFVAAVAVSAMEDCNDAR